MEGNKRNSRRKGRALPRAVHQNLKRLLPQGFAESKVHSKGTLMKKKSAEGAAMVEA